MGLSLGVGCSDTVPGAPAAASGYVACGPMAMLAQAGQPAVVGGGPHKMTPAAKGGVVAQAGGGRSTGLVRRGCWRVVVELGVGTVHKNWRVYAILSRRVPLCVLFLVLLVSYLVYRTPVTVTVLLTVRRPYIF